MLALGDRAVTIRGNGDRELVESRLRLDSGRERIDPGDIWSTRTHWAAERLDRASAGVAREPAAARGCRRRRPRRRALLPRLAAQRRGDRDGALVRGAHRADARRRDAADGRARPHARAVRPPRGRGAGSSTPGSVGLPYEERGRGVLGPARPGRRAAPNALRRRARQPRACARAASPAPATTPTGS